MLVTTIHIIQLLVHAFMQISQMISFGTYKTYTEIFCSQFTYLTNLSNWLMFAYLIPFVYYDITNNTTKPVSKRYPDWLTMLFQGMNSVIFLVMASYQLMVYLDPNLLLSGFTPSDWQLKILFYTHAGNWIFMQIDFILYEHTRVPNRKMAAFFAVYTVGYLGIYGLYFYMTGLHVYPFQKEMSMIHTVIMYFGQFLTLFVIDIIYNCAVHLPIFQIINLEKRHNGNILKNKKN